MTGLLDELRADGIEVTLGTGTVRVRSVVPLTDGQLAEMRARKAELLAELAAEARERRRARALAELAADPSLTCAMFADAAADPITVTVAIRGIGSAELALERFDPFELIRLASGAA